MAASQNIIFTAVVILNVILGSSAGDDGHGSHHSKHVIHAPLNIKFIHHHKLIKVPVHLKKHIHHHKHLSHENVYIPLKEKPKPIIIEDHGDFDGHGGLNGRGGIGGHGHGGSSGLGHGGNDGYGGGSGHGGNDHHGTPVVIIQGGNGYSSHGGGYGGGDAGHSHHTTIDIAGIDGDHNSGQAHSRSDGAESLRNYRYGESLEDLRQSWNKY